MENLVQIWDTIVKSNTFNFIVMLAILAWVVNKFNLKASLDNLKEKVIRALETSKTEKEKGILALENAKKSTENLETEITENLSQAENQAKNIMNEVLTTAENKVKQIQSNIEKVITSEEKQISARLMSKTAQKSAEKAKSKIVSLLQEHPELHEKFINESLEELDRIEL